MATRHAYSFLLLLSLALAACASEVGSEDFDEVELTDLGEGKFDHTSELYVRASETSLWVRPQLSRQDRSGTDTFVLRGRASRNLVSGRAFVFDDVYGAFAQIAPRSFEVSWTVSELRSLLNGVSQFIGLEFVPSSTRPTHMTARVIVRPHVAAQSDSGSGIELSDDVRAVVSGGRVVYRVRGTANAPIESISADAAGVDLVDRRIVDRTTFEIDLLEDHVLLLASRSGTLNVRATLVGGQTATNTASLVLAVSTLGFTSADPSETWPPPSCTDAVRACIDAVPAGSTDLGHCGDAVDVLVCVGTSQIVIDDVAIVEALRALDTRLADPAYTADATGLVGATRAAGWLEGARLTAEDRLQALFGGVYPDLAARDAAIAAAVEAAIDFAYAYPLELVEPFAPIPGDAERARHVAADALLAHIAAQDWENTALWRPLTVLTREYRARHVESVRAFREVIEPVDGLAPNSDAYVGDWIGLYSEVELDRTTQNPIRVLVEID